MTEGFIVHPFETGNRKYHAMYGNNKNTIPKSFNTLNEAKRYLARKGVHSADYDAPSGVKLIKTGSSKSPVTQHRRLTRPQDPIRMLIFGR